ncbi:MAG: HAD-IIIA family hydrolase [Candidatus Azobacteroides pseudotrichonymphae]|jgi:3-deoxy-D-manno-octulosonate 8-phosphate phosphatase (KDO 8-P phosphatase)|uniref:3-deoxy-D-manno-octulosonate 8-phosphate phosphatase n=1 Tax=Azobacteroides pseudotrichonymphae genomovar. CFP2 TaxID=511995 RepID=B6YR26_AZOPC|nr:HAD hydrolase family protein [Candidatus Azobacteroides pseudotrichonymphae]MDR0529952.1 HAD hydrolase family protein [Bacteroidales bacterium OttesenSCG-928-I14]BAG83648.1 3-deoxy-D-manno-octulosonate 8-phosphate phosphatase [Candidatus Azobacteroides pseudotrichonymphae genomovar. CFP2]GMO32179.1 MAG: HAD-IIIA family hydrolase [Candidatus Azobacteroides pseudotrichonymphae]
MSNILYDLKKIKAFVFDVDGVLSPDSIPFHPSGKPMRIFNTKDGYAMQLAAKQKFRMGIITGGDGLAIFKRFNSLGFQHIYLKSIRKIDDFNDFLQKSKLYPEEVCYVGDDIPDYEIMQVVGLPACPVNASVEIKSIAKYISSCKGGYGVGRDIIEQVLKVQDKWMQNNAFSSW